MNLKVYVTVLLSLLALPMLARAADELKDELTLTRVIELAATNSPEVRLSVTRIAEGEARRAGAEIRTLENPKFDLAAGPRNGTDSSVDLEVGFEIPFELGNRRSKRVAVAQAGIQREHYAAGEVRRLSVAAAVSAYYRALHSEERLRSARNRKILADEQMRIARERHLTGDVAQFEVNLARTEVGRAASEISAAEGRAAQARTILAKTLGRPSAVGIQVVGDLKDRALFDAILASTSARDRDDLLAARAEVAASGAAIDLAKAEGMPDLAFRLSYKREGNDNIALGGLTVSLPFLNPRTGPVQEAQVQHQRAKLAAELRHAAISAEVEGARAAYGGAVESLRRMEMDALALMQENETLANESYRAGKINLSTLLQVRRDALETRREYLERLLEAADAGIELALATGSWSTTN